MRYRTYMQSASWRERREAVIGRSGGMCERCGRWPIVNVHHLSYERVGAERDEDLLGVCTRCHDEIHGISMS